MLDSRQDLQEYLYCRGFLLTDRNIRTDKYPFYSNWKKYSINGYKAYVHYLQTVTIYENDIRSLLLIGHAYNPYTMEANEHAILEKIAGVDNRIDYINELTGVFFLAIFKNDDIEFHVDASSMQAACYGNVDGHLYVSSHMRLIGDILRLKTTDYVKRLVNYKWYHYMMGNYLPGDITCYEELTRVVPNTYVTYSGNCQEETHDYTNGVKALYDCPFCVTRFYPAHKIQMCQNEQEYREVIKEAARIMKNTMALIPLKWKRPAISLTGGIDSNTTFAAANGDYDKYTTFSYVSMYRESVDAEKAEEISRRFHVPWKRYDVPESNEEVEDFDIFKQMLERAQGGIGYSMHINTLEEPLFLKICLRAIIHLCINYSS